MSTPKLLTGEYETVMDNVFNDEDVRRLQDLLAERHSEMIRMQQRLIRLRTQLRPLYDALRGIFENLPDDEATPTTGATAAAWTTWKNKLGGKQAEFIQALIDHGPMSRDQLRIVTKSGWSTVDMTLGKLRQLQLIVKEGNRWALKRL